MASAEAMSSLAASSQSGSLRLYPAQIQELDTHPQGPSQHIREERGSVRGKAAKQGRRTSPRQLPDQVWLEWEVTALWQRVKS